jgi:hypothetical protein
VLVVAGVGVEDVEAGVVIFAPPGVTANHVPSTPWP